MMAVQHAYTRDFRDNPMGTKGFSFIEFASSDPDSLKMLFHALGFHCVGHHSSRPLHWYQQGNIRFLISEEREGFSHSFHTAHGPSACAMGFEVEDAQAALRYAKNHHGTACKKRMLELQIPALMGIGDSFLYLVDEKGEQSIFDQFFVKDERDKTPSAGLQCIDHLTHNVHRGGMDRWAKFYEEIFNFHEIRFFDIKGDVTGLVSRAMTSPCGNIRIPINESADEKSQIEEYLQEYNGEGIQHIALQTNNIVDTVAKLRANGLCFMDVPDTYYDMLEERLPAHGESIEALQKHKILLDGHRENGGYCLLLQIFTETVIGPIFFEIIQRKGDEGFGEGNFQALFESIERDQIKRGVIRVDN